MSNSNNNSASIIKRGKKKIKDKIPKLPTLNDMSNFFSNLKEEIPRMPITVFYSYLWNHDKLLLIKSLGVNYIFPLLLEILPWTSRRKLLIKIRKKRVQINYGMQTNKPFNWGLLQNFILITVIYSLIDTTLRFWQERISLEHKFAIRRLVMQRMLYSEILSFDRLKEKTKDRLTDVGQTLAFFNFTVPAVIASIYALYLEARELWKHRKRIDLLALIYPFLMYFIRKLFDLVRQNTLKKEDNPTLAKSEKHKKKMSEFVSNIMQGLTDIQINNLQRSLMNRLDYFIDRELSSTRGLNTFMDNFLNTLSSRSLFQFITETYIIHTIMKRKKIAFDKYLIIQEDLDHCLKAVKKLADLWSVSRNILEYQKKVEDLINIPNWQGEHRRVRHNKILNFHELRIRNIRFYYPDNNITPALDLEGDEMVFLPGKKYAIIGQNEAGKSTLAHIITKIYTPSSGWISFNDIPYSDIGRVSLREVISYVSQRSFLFPGTIRDNIKIANPNATEEQVMEAAIAAGLSTFGQSSSPCHSRYQSEDEDEDVDTRDDDFASYFQPMAKSSKSIFSSITDDESNDCDDDDDEDGSSDQRRGLSSSSYDDFDDDDFLANNIHVKHHKKRISKSAPTTAPNTPQLDHTLKTLPTLYRNLEEYEKEKIKLILDQEVLARGINMSGGLAQSVALARIFVKTSAKIIILDEAASQMDAIKKREIWPRIFDFASLHGMSLIIITHDLTSIQNVDLIYVLEGGKVVHRGSHESLLASHASQYLQLLGVNIYSNMTY